MRKMKSLCCFTVLLFCCCAVWGFDKKSTINEVKRQNEIKKVSDEFIKKLRESSNPQPQQTAVPNMIDEYKNLSDANNE